MAKKDDTGVIEMDDEYDLIGVMDDEDEQEPGDGGDTLDEVIRQVRADVEDAIDFMDSDFEDERTKAQKYYNGESDLPLAGTNRSKYVHTKVRDTIRALKPDIMRVLVGSPWPVEFLPGNAMTAEMAEVQTQYVTQLFNRLGGYKVVYDASHTACLHKMGVVKAYYDVRKVPRYAQYTGISAEHLQHLRSDETVTVIIDSETTTEIEGPNGPVEVPIYDVDVVSFEKKGRTRMESVKPEDFFIDEWATSHDDFRVLGHRRNVTVSTGVSMGFDRDEIAELPGDDPETNDAIGLSEQRRGYRISRDKDMSADPSQKMFLLTEAYAYADLDNLGVAQLYRFWLGGPNHKYLDHERVDDHPFAMFSIDPEPFAVFGTSIYDLTGNDQDVGTSLTRAMIDNAHMSNNPRLAVHETMVNMEDVLNNDIGAPIRTRGAGQVQAISVPFTGGNLLPLMQYLDEAVDNKTGITRASVGLDPSALQSTDKQAVQNTIAKQAGQVELAVRNLAETGMTRLFRLLLKTTLENPDPVTTVRLAGKYVPAPLAAFDPDLDMEVAVGTGTSSHEQKVMALQAVQAEQDKIMGLLGPGNPVVSLTQMFNTVQDGLALFGMKNVQRYFTPITPEVEQQIRQQMEQAAQAAAQQPDPMQGIIAAEQIKAQAKIQTDTVKAGLDATKAARQQVFDMTKLRAQTAVQVGQDKAKNDLERDRMIQDLYLRLAQIEATAATQIDTAEINADVQRAQAANDRKTG